MTQKKSRWKAKDNGKLATGRLNRYQSLVAPRLETIKMWRRNGLTDKEIAENLGVSIASFYKYKLAHSELVDSLKVGRADADAQVVNAMFRSATGYDVTETEMVYELDEKTGQPSPTPTKIRQTKKHVEPKVAAQIFITKNRLPKEYRDRVAMEHGGPDGAPLPPGTVIFNLGDNGHGPGSAGKPEPDQDGD